MILTLSEISVIVLFFILYVFAEPSLDRLAFLICEGEGHVAVAGLALVVVLGPRRGREPSGADLDLQPFAWVPVGSGAAPGKNLEVDAEVIGFGAALESPLTLRRL
jgi:hypothetical protein